MQVLQVVLFWTLLPSTQKDSSTPISSYWHRTLVFQIPNFDCTHENSLRNDGADPSPVLPLITYYTRMSKNQKKKKHQNTQTAHLSPNFQHPTNQTISSYLNPPFSTNLPCLSGPHFALPSCCLFSSSFLMEEKKIAKRKYPKTTD